MVKFQLIRYQMVNLLTLCFSIIDFSCWDHFNFWHVHFLLLFTYTVLCLWLFWGVLLTSVGMYSIVSGMNDVVRNFIHLHRESCARWKQYHWIKNMLYDHNHYTLKNCWPMFQLIWYHMANLLTLYFSVMEFSCWGHFNSGLSILYGYVFHALCLFLFCTKHFMIYMPTDLLCSTFPPWLCNSKSRRLFLAAFLPWCAHNST